MDAMLAWAVILASDKTAGEPQSEARNANTGGDCERAKPRAIDFYGHFTEITQGNPGTPMDAPDISASDKITGITGRGSGADVI